MGSAISLSKAKLRKELRGQRRSLGATEHAMRSALAASAIARLPAFKAGARVAVYLPFDRETDTAALLAAAKRRGVHIFVPVVTDLRHRSLRFHPLSGKTRRGVFGISVPDRHGRWTAPRWFNLIIVPLVGVDGAGLRLGMGGGFYDRALAFRRGRRRWMGPRLVGLGFDCQRTHTVFAESWDVRLDSLATESGLRHFSLPTSTSGEQ
ncbi:MAG: 5-formyltetrahydrofolate cyclo-ligase [Pseudomonadota bacterium]|nr:5-formyltetrahydrofolate cyclo-ligase [Pseudomonadota bacterium]